VATGGLHNPLVSPFLSPFAFCPAGFLWVACIWFSPSFSLLGWFISLQPPLTLLVAMMLLLVPPLLMPHAAAVAAAVVAAAAAFAAFAFPAPAGDGKGLPPPEDCRWFTAVMPVASITASRVGLAVVVVVGASGPYCAAAVVALPSPAVKTVGMLHGLRVWDYSHAGFPELPLLQRRCLFPPLTAAAVFAGQAQVVLEKKPHHVEGRCRPPTLSEIAQRRGRPLLQCVLLLCSPV
jgi:hypothetical protein